MKQLFGNAQGESYSFDASAQTITFTGANLNIENILLINNATRETIIYNPFESGKGYTSLTNNVLTLEYDTTSFNDADKLQIFYDNSNELPVAIEELSIVLKKLLYKLDMMPINTTVAVSSGASKTQVLLSTDSNINQVSNLAALRALGANTVDAAQALADPLMDLTFNNQVRNRITVS